MNSSLEIAKHYGKRHALVIRDIRTFMKRFEGVTAIEKHIRRSSYRDRYQRTQMCFLLSEVAVCLLTLGYTGAKPFPTKYAYVLQLFEECPPDAPPESVGAAS